MLARKRASVHSDEFGIEQVQQGIVYRRLELEFELPYIDGSGHIEQDPFYVQGDGGCTTFGEESRANVC